MPQIWGSGGYLVIAAVTRNHSRVTSMVSKGIGMRWTWFPVHSKKGGVMLPGAHTDLSLPPKCAQSNRAPAMHAPCRACSPPSGSLIRPEPLASPAHLLTPDPLRERQGRPGRSEASNLHKERAVSPCRLLKNGILISAARKMEKGP